MLSHQCGWILAHSSLQKCFNSATLEVFEHEWTVYITVWTVYIKNYICTLTVYVMQKCIPSKTMFKGKLSITTVHQHYRKCKTVDVPPHHAEISYYSHFNMMIINLSVMQDTKSRATVIFLVWHLLMHVEQNFPETFHTNVNLWLKTYQCKMP